MNVINIADAKTADLVAFYNENIVRFPDGTAIKKFADRKTAEKRVADLVEKIAAHFPDDETPEGTIPDTSAPESNGETDTQESNDADGAATDDQTNENAAPESNDEAAVADMSNEGAPEVQPESTDGEPTEEQNEDPENEAETAARAQKSHSAFNALQATLATIQETQAKAKENGEKVVTKSSASKASNSDGVAASWVDSEIRAARLTRDGVSVELDGKNVGVFKSTRDAFRGLRLPDNKHIRFRLKLKEAHRDNGESATFEHNGKSYVFSIVAVEV